MSITREKEEQEEEVESFCAHLNTSTHVWGEEGREGGITFISLHTKRSYKARNI